MSGFLEMFRSAGWLALPLVGFSVFNLGLYGSIWLRIRKHERSLGTMAGRDSQLQAAIQNLEEDWEDISHPLYIACSWIASIAGLSTLTGLLGTVIGIQSSFREMQIQGNVSLDVFAGGVSLALSTTIIGLGVAIPSYFLYQLAKTQIGHLEKRFFRGFGNREGIPMPNTHSVD